MCGSEAAAAIVAHPRIPIRHPPLEHRRPRSLIKILDAVSFNIALISQPQLLLD